MTLVLEDAGKDLTLSLQDMTLLRFDGLDATRPDVERAVAPITALITHLPDARISRSGEFLEVRDIDAFADRLTATLESSPIPELRTMAQVAHVPAVKQAMEGDLRTLWANWVQDWLVFPLPPGADQITTVETDVGGRRRPWPVLMQHRGLVRDAPSLSLLSTREDFEGRQAEAIVGVPDAVPAQRDASKLPGSAPAGLRVTRTNVAALEPGRDRPHHTRYELRVEGGDGSGSEVRDTVFDWEHAVGCGR
jgi:hypothetical protein